MKDAFHCINHHISNSLASKTHMYLCAVFVKPHAPFFSFDVRPRLAAKHLEGVKNSAVAMLRPSGNMPLHMKVFKGICMVLLPSQKI